jgi:spore germination protein GerM
MTEQILSVYIGAEGEIIALSKNACYEYKNKLSTEQTQTLISKIKEKKEINTDHWVEKWKFNGVPIK